MTTRAQILPKFGLEHLYSGERSCPAPGPGQLRLRMRAVSLNYRDIMMIRGHYNPRQPLPLVPCSDGVGVVEAVGEGVTTWSVGDRVCPIFAQRWLDGEPTKAAHASTLGGPLDGTLREHMVVDADGVVAAPAHLSDVEAATLPCAAVTAWSALVVQGGVTAGDTVLLQGTGGVSMFALQFAKLLGARVIITSSSDEKLARARALGADETINYRQDARWGKTARALTDGLGVDHVVEVGGAGTLEQSMRAVRLGGTISLIGVLSGGAQPLNIVPILMNQIRVQGVFVGHRAAFVQMNRAITQHQLRPLIDRVFPFEDASAAFAHQISGAHMGKVCVSLEDL